MRIFLTESEESYKHHYEKYKDCGPEQYLTNVINLSYFEKASWMKVTYANSNLIDSIFEMFSRCIIKPYTSKLLEHSEGLSYFLENGDIKKLEIVTRVYNMNEGFEDIREQVYQFVLNKGKSILQEQQDKHLKFYEFYKKYLKITS